MNYRDILGDRSVPSKIDKIESDRIHYSNKFHDSDYEFVRFGTPERAVKYADVIQDVRYLKNHFLEFGYSSPSYKRIHNKDFRRHVATLRVGLDLWELIPISKSMSKEEIYFKCLTERAKFTEWVKKARSTTVRYLTSETNTSIEEEYLLSEYRGYDSMLHERYLINWDTSEETDDVKYAFIESQPIPEKNFRTRVRKLFSDFKINADTFSDELDMLESLKNSMTYDAHKGKSTLMRETWTNDIQTNGSYFATRRVLCIASGNVRDTGVADPGTLLKVKLLNKLARSISEAIPYCANAPLHSVEQRLKRVLKKNTFLHLDFKKYGLTFPRALTNIVIEEIGNFSGLDTSSLLIKNFFIELDGEVYKTCRGSMLGWLDPINCIAVCAILHYLSCERELGFDFISFNDDVEISKYVKKDIPGTLELLRMAVVCELDMFDIPISLDKTYGSLSSVFLEKYNYFDKYNLDMNKRTLCLKQYITSLTATAKWEAKINFAFAFLEYEHEDITDRCLYTSDPEFRPEEKSMSLWSGGWFIRVNDNYCDDSFVECDELGIYLGLELQKFKREKYTTTRVKASSNSKIQNSVEKKCYESFSPESARSKFKELKTIRELNSDIETIQNEVDHSIFLYDGKEVDFPIRVSWTINMASRVLDRRK